jgi:iron complex outermembrane receptor protein
MNSQRSRKGNPPYVGHDPDVRVRYWRWPSWDKDSLYFVSRKSLGGDKNLKIRAFYDSFRNELASYDNDQYSSQTRPYAFRSCYDDYSVGGSAEFRASALGRHHPTLALLWKDDVHREKNLGEPFRTFHDRLFSLAVEDSLRLGERTDLLAGLSFDFLKTLQAEDWKDGAIAGFPRSSSFSLNPQIAVNHSFGDRGNLHFGVWQRARFPTMKDRFSYRLGLALPNPGLQEERSLGLEAGYSFVIAHRIFMEISLFHNFIRDLIRPYYLEPNLYQSRNVGRIGATGSDVSLSGQWCPEFETTLNYTYLNRQDLTNRGILLTETPRHTLLGELKWSVLNQIAVQTNFRGEAGRWNLNQAGNSYRMDNFLIWGVTGSCLLRSWTFQLGVDNLSNHRYELFEGYPEPGRILFANLNYRF